MSIGVEIVLVLSLCFVAVFACMLALWALSIPLKDVSIVDVFWGPGFAVAAWVAAIVSGGDPVHKWVIVALTTVWAVRLGFYLTWRKWGEGEDPRYTALIDHLGPENRIWTGLVRVFITQGVIMWLVALPVMLGQVWREPVGLGVLAWIGVALWLVGFLFESIGDWQMVRFKADPSNAGKVMDRGLWRYTRHPNYFGDACVWFGLWMIASDNPWGLLTVISPILMTYFLLRVTGKSLLERRLKRSRPEYVDYVNRTSGFIPWFPKT